MGTRSSSGPSKTTNMQSTTRAAAVPKAAGRHPRTVPTARTMVNASTTSTSEARKAEPTAEAATLDVTGLITISRHAFCFGEVAILELSRFAVTSESRGLFDHSLPPQAESHPGPATFNS